MIWQEPLIFQDDLFSGLKKTASVLRRMKVRSDSFLVSSPEGEEILEFDYGFVCLGMKSASPVIPEIQKAFQDDDHVEIINVGDSVRARRIIEGTDEGRNILCTLEKRGYL